MTNSLFPRYLTRELDALFGRDEAGWWPRLETFAKDGTVYVRADLPGVDPKEVEVSLDGETLTIRGERKAEHQGEAYREVRYGRFERTLTVPEGLDPDKVSARYTNGVLEITLPAPVAAQPRKVPVTVEADSPKKAA